MPLSSSRSRALPFSRPEAESARRRRRREDISPEIIRYDFKEKAVPEGRARVMKPFSAPQIRSAEGRRITPGLAAKAKS
jgi:hypothetical protein